MLFPSFILDDLLYNDFQTFDNKTKVTKQDNGYNLSIAVPGVLKENIKVELDPANNQIMIEVTEGSTFVSAFKKVYEIPSTIDNDSISTSLNEGVLDITMTRKKESSRRKLM